MTYICLCKVLCTKASKMAQELSDVQLLGCPEPLEEMFIHRGRWDLIATQAGKEFLDFDLTREERFFNFLTTSDQVSCYTFQLKVGHFQ